MIPISKVVALGDGYFNPSKKGRVGEIALILLVWFDNFVVTDSKPIFFKVDGCDGTEKVLEALKQGKKPHVLLMNGIVHAGFNFVNPQKIFQETKTPVIVFQKEKPDMLAVYSALERHLNNWQERWKKLSSLTTLKPMRLIWPSVNNNPIISYVQSYGIDQGDAEAFINRSLLVADVPEQLREARSLARALGKFFELKDI